MKAGMTKPRLWYISVHFYEKPILTNQIYARTRSVFHLGEVNFLTVLKVIHEIIR